MTKIEIAGLIYRSGLQFVEGNREWFKIICSIYKSAQTGEKVGF